MGKIVRLSRQPMKLMIAMDLPRDLMGDNEHGIDFWLSFHYIELYALFDMYCTVEFSLDYAGRGRPP